MKKIYIENVRVALDLSYHQTVAILDIAVERGILHKGMDYYCSLGGVAHSHYGGKPLETIYCTHQDEYDDSELVCHVPSDFNLIPFYYSE